MFLAIQGVESIPWFPHAKIEERVGSANECALTLTGKHAHTYEEVAEILTDVIGEPIHYESPNLLSFMLRQRRNGTSWKQAGVMAMLYTITRFGNAASISKDIANVLGRAPRTLTEFSKDYRAHWLPERTGVVFANLPIAGTQESGKGDSVRRDKSVERISRPGERRCHLRGPCESTVFNRQSDCSLQIAENEVGIDPQTIDLTQQIHFDSYHGRNEERRTPFRIKSGYYVLGKPAGIIVQPEHDMGIEEGHESGSHSLGEYESSVSGSATLSGWLGSSLMLRYFFSGTTRTKPELRSISSGSPFSMHSSSSRKRFFRNSVAVTFTLQVYIISHDMYIKRFGFGCDTEGVIRCDSLYRLGFAIASEYSCLYPTTHTSNGPSVRGSGDQVRGQSRSILR